MKCTAKVISQAVMVFPFCTVCSYHCSLLLTLLINLLLTLLSTLLSIVHFTPTWIGQLDVHWSLPLQSNHQIGLYKGFYLWCDTSGVLLYVKNGQINNVLTLTILIILSMYFHISKIDFDVVMNGLLDTQSMVRSSRALLYMPMASTTFNKIVPWDHVLNPPLRALQHLL